MSRPITYLDILASTDAEAREEYEYDPRVAFFQQTHEEEEEVEANDENNHATTEDNQEIYVDNSEALLDAPRPVQAPPLKYKKNKRIILVDTAQRDWTMQPNAYSNIFSFSAGKSITLQTVPVYTNSKFIPINSPQNPGRIEGLANISGWSFAGVSYPGYNAGLPQGTFLFNETRSNVVTSTLGFGSDLQLSNVASIRLLRAALPLRRFDAFSSLVYTQSNINAAVTNQDYISSFHTHSYIFIHINNFYNQYFGANNASTTAFAALVQHQRQFISPGNVITVQHQDFYPWSDEAHEFNPPLMTLPNLQWYLDDQHGIPFNQRDIWEVRNVQFSISGILLGGLLTGAAVTSQLFFFVNHTDLPSNSPYFETFSPAEFRVGDVIGFYPPDVKAILADPSTNSTLRNFFTTFTNGAGYIINYVETQASDTLEFGQYFGAVPFAYDYQTQLSNTSTIGHLLDLSAGSRRVNIMINSNANSNIDAYNYQYQQSYPLRIINKSLQASLAFEVVTLEPDNSDAPYMIPA